MEVVVSDADFWAGRRVLLTGHTGFKGAWTALWLERMGAAVFGLSLPPVTQPALWHLLGRPGGEASIGDVRDAAVVAARMGEARPDIVLHMAAQALVHESYDDPVTTYQTNVMGLVNVLEAARRSDTVRAVVNVTSDKCYENREQIWAYRENEPMGGSDPYSASKGCAELITASYRKSFFSKPDGPRLASGRAGNVIGGGDWSADRLVPDCMRAFSAGRPVMIRNPLATRPWQHVLEPVAGYLTLARRLFERGNEVAEGWNFGPADSEAWPVGQVADRLVGEWGEGARWVQDAAVHPSEAQLLRVDASKAKVRLGWRPRLALNDALAWTVDWYKAVARGEDAKMVTSQQIERYEARA